MSTFRGENSQIRVVGMSYCHEPAPDTGQWYQVIFPKRQSECVSDAVYDMLRDKHACFARDGHVN
jgi:hypothetical protein